MFKVRMISMVRGKLASGDIMEYNNEAQMRRAIALFLCYGPHSVAVEVTPCSA